MKTKIGNPEINNLKTTRLTSIGFPDYVSLPLGTACAPPVGHKIKSNKEQIASADNGNTETGPTNRDYSIRITGPQFPGRYIQMVSGFFLRFF